MCSYVKLIFLILKVTNMMLKGFEVIPSSCQVVEKYVNLDKRYITVDV